MRPVLGVALELTALVSVLLPWTLVHGVVRVIYVLAAMSLATYLVHCPAHYLVGIPMGIRFERIRLGRTALVRILPHRLRGLARTIPILALSVDKGSLSSVSPARTRAMYYSGVVASCASAVVLAAAVSLLGDFVLSAMAWAFALGYTAFDTATSPKFGDVARARKSL